MHGEESVEAGSRGRSARANVVHCIECKGASGLMWRGWRAYRVDDPEADTRPELAFYCPTCAKREFDPS